MFTRLKNPLLGRSGCLALSLSAAAIAAWPWSARAQFSISSLTGNTAQDFNGLASSGTANAWANDTTLDGWYLFQKDALAITAYRADAGGSGTGAFYSWGTDATDRALGGVASGGAYFGGAATGTVAGWIAFGATNLSGGTLSQFTLGFDGEQWRDGGATVPAPQTMVLEYGFGSTFTGVSSWTMPGGSFNWTSPVFANTASGAAVVGNVAGAVPDRGGEVSGLTWASGETLWVRWVERNDTGNDHGLSIDDFVFSWAGSEVAAPLYWDLSGSSPGLGGSAGIWNLTEPNWSSDPGGSSPTGVFTPESEAIFTGVGGDVNIAAGGVTANGGLRFESPGYAVAGGPLTLGGQGTIQVAAAVAITANIAGSSGLVKAGAETLILTGVNTFTGNVRITGGVLSIDAETALGDAGNDLLLANGTFSPTASLNLAATRDLSGSGTIRFTSGQTLTTNGTVNLGSLELTNDTVGHLASGLLVLNGPSNTVGNLTFTDPVGVQAPNGLALGGNITVPLLGGTVSILGNIAAAAGTHTFDVADGPEVIDLLLAGNLSSPGTSARFNKNGSGTLRVTGSNSALLGGWRLGSAGTVVAPGGRLLIGEKNALGVGPGLQVFFNQGTIEAEAPLTGPNALTVGLSFGAGQETASGSGIFTMNTLAGSPMEFTGVVQIFKPANVSAYQHRIVVDTDVTFAAGFNSSTGTTSTGITLSGTGSLRLNAAANTIAEGIIVEGPDFIVAGSLSADSVFVKNGGFQGSGSVGELFIGDGLGSDARLTIGSGIGTLLADAVTLDADSTVALQIDSGVAAGIADQLRVAGNITLGAGVATLSLTDLSGVILAGGTSFTIIDAPNAVSVLSGFFAGLADGDRVIVGANEYEIFYHAGPDANDVILRVIPEPTSALLLALGGLLLASRRRARAAMPG